MTAALRISRVLFRLVLWSIPLCSLMLLGWYLSLRLTPQNSQKRSRFPLARLFFIFSTHRGPHSLFRLLQTWEYLFLTRDRKALFQFLQSNYSSCGGLLTTSTLLRFLVPSFSQGETPRGEVFCSHHLGRSWFPFELGDVCCGRPHPEARLPPDRSVRVPTPAFDGICISTVVSCGQEGHRAPTGLHDNRIHVHRNLVL